MNLTLKNVTHYFQDGTGERVTPLKNINLTVSSGDRLVIYGPSGSGKSTLLFILGCLLKPAQGEVLLDGHPLWESSEKELAQLRNRRIGFVFQMCYLLPTLTVRENILLPLWMQGKESLKSTQTKKTVESLLEQLGLEQRADFLPHQLSGGQRRRVALARALVNDPEIILADEPTAELEEEKRNFVGKWLIEGTKNNKIVVVATHDLSLASYAGKTFNLRHGQLEEIIVTKEKMCV